MTNIVAVIKIFDRFISSCGFTKTYFLHAISFNYYIVVIPSHKTLFSDSQSAIILKVSKMEGLQHKIYQTERELNAVKFILGIGGEKNDLVPSFRRWSKPELRGIYNKLQDYLNELQGTYKELQAKENILLTQQQSGIVLFNMIRKL